MNNYSNNNKVKNKNNNYNKIRFKCFFYKDFKNLKKYLYYI